MLLILLQFYKKSLDRGTYITRGAIARRTCSSPICNFVCGASAVTPSRVGFRITVFDNRVRGDNAKPRLERVAAINGSESGTTLPQKSRDRRRRSVGVSYA
jgi:hypothetical protein